MSVARGREPFHFYFPDNEPGNKWDEAAFQECLRYNDLLYFKRVESIQDENKRHPVEQMKFAWGLMWKMRNLLGGEGRMPGWFKYVYGENPLYAKAWSEIELEQWQKDAGIYKTVNEVLAEKAKEAKKVFFDPPVEKTLVVDEETGEVLNAPDGPIDRTEEGLGF